MATTVLITTHPGAALAQACLRGRWIPLPLPADQAHDLSHLLILRPGATSIEVVGRIWSLQCIGTLDGRLHWLPLLDGRRRLPSTRRATGMAGESNGPTSDSLSECNGPMTPLSVMAR